MMNESDPDHNDRETQKPGLRVELFVSDVQRSVDFYIQSLGFAVVRSTPGDYAALAREGAVIGLNRAAGLAPDHPVHIAAQDRAGRGVEIVVIAGDVQHAHARAVASGYRIAAPLTKQPWGLSDFRIIDPDGYYIRVTGTSV